jgi:hypothetical protein
VENSNPSISIIDMGRIQGTEEPILMWAVLVSPLCGPLQRQFIVILTLGLFEDGNILFY